MSADTTVIFASIIVVIGWFVGHWLTNERNRQDARLKLKSGIYGRISFSLQRMLSLLEIYDKCSDIEEDDDENAASNLLIASGCLFSLPSRVSIEKVLSEIEEEASEKDDDSESENEGEDDENDENISSKLVDSYVESIKAECYLGLIDEGWKLSECLDSLRIHGMTGNVNNEVDGLPDKYNRYSRSC